MISSQSMQGQMLSKKLRELTLDDINKISNIYEKHKQGTLINEPGNAKSVDLTELKNNDYSFVPGRYIEIVEEKVDEEQTKKEILELSKEIENLFDEFEELIPKVKDSIKKAIEFKKEK
jgi:type I restriction enzyme M protein